MGDYLSAELAELTEGAKKKKRFLIALFGNVLLLVTMLGGPFARGIVRAHRSWDSFARFGACVYGGTPLEDGGLGVPIGSEAHFAARLIAGEKAWPERCVTLLQAFTSELPIFLLPSVKVAENDVHAAADLVERELSAVLVRVPGERMSTRPLRAIEQLRSALARQAQAAGVLEVPAADAFRLDEKRGLPIPTRVPIYASSDARVRIWGADSDLHALAVDGTGVSYVHVAAGGMTQTRLQRPKLLESFLPSEDGGLFVWAMPRARCRERKEGCASKALGVAPLLVPLSELPLPRWIGAHPAGRIDRSMWSRGSRLSVLAEASEQRRELREFALPSEPVDKATSELPPLPATRADGAQALDDSWLFGLGGEPVALAVRRSESALELLRLVPQGPEPLSSLEGPAKSAWLAGSACPDGAALSFGSEHAFAVARLSAEGALRRWPALELGLTDVLHDRDAGHDRVLNLCLPGGRALVLVRDAQDKLQAIACEPGAARCNLSLIATGVQTFAALFLRSDTAEKADGSVLVASAGSKNLAQIQLRRLGPSGTARGAARTVAACWAPLGGLCGAPLLERIGARVLLGAREGTDLLMLESPDDGEHWEPLRGLKKHH